MPETWTRTRGKRGPCSHLGERGGRHRGLSSRAGHRDPSRTWGRGLEDPNSSRRPVGQPWGRRGAQGAALACLEAPAHCPAAPPGRKEHAGGHWKLGGPLGKPTETSHRALGQVAHSGQPSPDCPGIPGRKVGIAPSLPEPRGAGVASPRAHSYQWEDPGLTSLSLWWTHSLTAH